MTSSVNSPFSQYIFNFLIKNSFNFRVIPISIQTEMLLRTKILSDSNFDGVLVHPNTAALHYNKENAVKLIICKEYFTSSPIAIYGVKDFFLIGKLSEIIENLKSGGIIDFWHFQHVKIIPEASKPNDRKALTLNHFKGAFVILILGCLTSFVVFVMEEIGICFNCQTKMLKKLKN